MGNQRRHLTNYLGDLSWLPSEYSSKEDVGTITAVGDLVAPKTPTNVIASNGTERIKVEWDKVTKSADDSDCNDLSHYNVYYSASSGIDISDDTTYDGIETRKTLTWSQEVSVGITKYYVVTAEDDTGNESSTSSETSATSQAVTITPTLPDYVDNFDDILAGDGIIGLVFKRPSSAWNGFSHYKLYYDVDDGGGYTGSWAILCEWPNPAYVHKYDSKNSDSINTSYDYQYKLTFVDVDGNETDGTTREITSAELQAPDDNSNVTGNTFLAQNIVAVNEVRGNEIYAGSSIEIGSSGELYSSKTSYLDTTAGWWIGDDSGTAKLNIGDSFNYLKWDGSTLDIRGSLNADDITTGTIDFSSVGKSNLTVSASDSEISIDASLQVTGNIYCASNNVQLGQNVGPNNIDGISVQSGGAIEITDASGRTIFDASNNFKSVPKVSDISVQNVSGFINGTSRETVFNVAAETIIAGGAVYTHLGDGTKMSGCYLEIDDNSGTKKIYQPANINEGGDASRFGHAPESSKPMLVYTLPYFQAQGSCTITLYNNDGVGRHYYGFLQTA